MNLFLPHWTCLNPLWNGLTLKMLGFLTSIRIPKKTLKIIFKTIFIQIIIKKVNLKSIMWENTSILDENLKVSRADLLSMKASIERTILISISNNNTWQMSLSGYILMFALTTFSVDTSNDCISWPWSSWIEMNPLCSKTKF